MTKPGGIIIAAIGLFTASVIGGVIGREAFRSPTKNRTDINSVLRDISSEINKSLPIIVDKETELYTTAAAKGKIIYFYRLTNVTTGKFTDLTFEAMLHKLRKDAINAGCTTPQTRDAFLKKGITMQYNYADKDRQHLGAFEIKPSDCGF